VGGFDVCIRRRSFWGGRRVKRENKERERNSGEGGRAAGREIGIHRKKNEHSDALCGEGGEKKTSTEKKGKPTPKAFTSEGEGAGFWKTSAASVYRGV